MKKLMKLLALALAVVMLLPAAALAAEGEAGGPKLVLNHLDWNEGHFIPDETLQNPDDWEDTLGYNPLREDAVIFFVLDGGKKIPVIPEGDGNLTVRKLRRDEIAPNAAESEYYTCLAMKEMKDGVLTTEYEGQTLTLSVIAILNDWAMYTEPEAKLEYATNVWNFSPLMKENSVYLVFASADETHGRHMAEVSLSKDCPDNDYITLEKVSGTAYKCTLKNVDIQDIHPQIDITWQDAAFLGGRTYTDMNCEFYGCEWATTLVSESPTLDYSLAETPVRYDDVKDKLSNELTLKTGESRKLYTGFTYFPGDPAAWVVRGVGAQFCQASSDALKITVDEEEPTRMTISCDMPGTYTFTVDNSHWTGNVYGLTHANGKAYTEAEVRKWDEDTPYIYDDNGTLLVLTDLEKWETAPFEEAFPGEIIDYESWLEKDVWAPVTVTVESDKLPFTDVDEGSWYEKAVRFVSGKGYMTGETASRFNPEGNITAAEFSQLLYNKEGKPDAAEGAAFQGAAGQWYAPAMLWAAGQGIVTDTGDAAVEPEKALTRQQIALMLYNSLGKPEATAGLSAFTDADQIADWAKPAMEWAVSAKVFQGSGGKLAPADTATRAEVAQLLLNYFG